MTKRMTLTLATAPLLAEIRDREGRLLNSVPLTPEWVLTFVGDFNFRWEKDA